MSCASSSSRDEEVEEEEEEEGDEVDGDIADGSYNGSRSIARDWQPLSLSISRLKQWTTDAACMTHPRNPSPVGSWPLLATLSHCLDTVCLRSPNFSSFALIHNGISSTHQSNSLIARQTMRVSYFI